MSVTGEPGVGTGEGRRAGAGHRRGAELRARAAGRAHSSGAHRGGPARVVVPAGVRAREPRHARRRPLRVGRGAGPAGHPLPDVRPVRRVPHRGRLARRWPARARRTCGCAAAARSGADELPADERFADNAARVRQPRRADRARSRTSCVRGRARTGSACSRPRRAGRGGPDLAQVLRRAPGRRARLRAGAARTRRRRLPGASARRCGSTGSRCGYPAPAPALGADTRAVLAEVGLEHDDIDAWSPTGWRWRHDRRAASTRRGAPPHDRAGAASPRPRGVESRRARGRAEWWRGRSRDVSTTRPATCGRARADGDGPGGRGVRAPGHRVPRRRRARRPHRRPACAGRASATTPSAVAALSAAASARADARASRLAGRDGRRGGARQPRGVTAALDAPPRSRRRVDRGRGELPRARLARGVGSVRWRVDDRGPGGHAWEDADAPSAVHAAAGMIAGARRAAAHRDRRPP